MQKVTLPSRALWEFPLEVPWSEVRTKNPPLRVFFNTTFTGTIPEAAKILELLFSMANHGIVAYPRITIK